MKFYQGKPQAAHPEFPNRSVVACQTSGSDPTGILDPDIKFTLADNAAINKYHRRVVGTTWHLMRTCAMKPWKQGGVVNPKLNVYGVHNLKITS
ncbi:hypothetical protein AX16_010917, partial [Volvariella volvacea WC 439]